MKNALFVFFLCIVLAVVAQMASPPILVFTGGCSIILAFWWGYRPKPKERVVHRHPRASGAWWGV